jgi:hypothetical protein
MGVLVPTGEVWVTKALVGVARTGERAAGMSRTELANFNAKRLARAGVGPKPFGSTSTMRGMSGRQTTRLGRSQI